MHQRLTPQPARHPDLTAKAAALAYLMFERPDLDKGFIPSDIHVAINRRGHSRL